LRRHRVGPTARPTPLQPLARSHPYLLLLLPTATTRLAANFFRRSIHATRTPSDLGSGPVDDDAGLPPPAWPSGPFAHTGQNSRHYSANNVVFSSAFVCLFAC